MKRLSVYDLKDEDSLSVDFEAILDPQVAWERELSPFLQVLEEYAGEWMPDVVNGKRQRKYTRASTWKALEERNEDKWATIGLYRTVWPALDMTLRLRPPHLPSTLGLTIEIKPLSFFAEEERCRKLVEMIAPGPAATPSRMPGRTARMT